MSEFRVMHKDVWETVRVFAKDHPPEAITLLYLEVGPLTNFAGVFYAPIVDIARATGLDAMEVQMAVTGLNQRGLIVYDFDRRLIYVKGLLARQLRGLPNTKQAKGVITILDGLPKDSSAVQAFVNEHLKTPELAGPLSDRVSGPLCETEREREEREKEVFVKSVRHGNGTAKLPPGGAATSGTPSLRSGVADSPKGISEPSLETITETEGPIQPIQQTEPLQPEEPPATTEAITAENIDEVILALLAKA